MQRTPLDDANGHAGAGTPRMASAAFIGVWVYASCAAHFSSSLEVPLPNFVVHSGRAAVIWTDGKEPQTEVGEERR